MYEFAQIGILDNGPYRPKILTKKNTALNPKSGVGVARSGTWIPDGPGHPAHPLTQTTHLSLPWYNVHVLTLA